jgi:hypothetical protein
MGVVEKNMEKPGKSKGNQASFRQLEASAIGSFTRIDTLALAVGDATVQFIAGCSSSGTVRTQNRYTTVAAFRARGRTHISLTYLQAGVIASAL